MPGACHLLSSQDAFDNLVEMHGISTRANWFSEINSLVSSNDPSIVNDLNDIMKTFKP